MPRVNLPVVWRGLASPAQAGGLRQVGCCGGVAWTLAWLVVAGPGGVSVTFARATAASAASGGGDELARYGLAARAGQLKRHSPPRQYAILLAAITRLAAKTIDDALDLVDLLMATELAGKAHRQSEKATIQRWPPRRSLPDAATGPGAGHHGTVAQREDVVRHAQAQAPHPPCSSGPAATIGVHRLPVPAGGDRAGSALVSPLRTVLSRC
ncbi:MAG: hypothetical protein ACRDTX_16475 [Pseudonocardiaceae bacterium]